MEISYLPSSPKLGSACNFSSPPGTSTFRTYRFPKTRPGRVVHLFLVESLAFTANRRDKHKHKVFEHLHPITPHTV